MRKIYLLTVLLIATLPACDKIEEATSRDIKIDNVKFNFETAIQALKSTRSAEINSFSIMKTIQLSDLNSQDLVDYASKIKEVKVNRSEIVVTFNPTGNYTITDLEIDIAGVSGSPLVIPSYSANEAFVAPAKMKEFTSAFLMKLLSNTSVDVMVSGNTDAPAGTTIKISYDNDLVFTAKLL